MRISGLLVVLLGVSVCAASDSARQSASAAATTNPFSSDWFDPSAIARHDFIKLPSSDGGDWVYHGFNSAGGGDVTCYTMHIFGMKRESPDSDITLPDGQWTCQRASKYSVKIVEEPGKAPPR